MNSVFSYPAAAHDYQITGGYVFLFGRFAVNNRRHNSDGGDKNQAFPHVAVMKKELTEWGWNAAFIPAIPHPFDYTGQKPAWMKMRFEISGIILRSNTETVTSHHQFRPQAGAHRVPVYPHNSGQGAPICFHV